MEPRADFITIATANLDAARAFYRDGLGWTPLLDVADEIIFFQIGHGLVLGLFDAVKFTGDMNAGDAPAVVSGLTLSHNENSPEAVTATFDAAVAAGAASVKEPQYADFGGFHAHFADPNGLVWEIAHNPAWQVDEDGKVTLGLVE